MAVRLKKKNIILCVVLFLVLSTFLYQWSKGSVYRYDGVEDEIYYHDEGTTADLVAMNDPFRTLLIRESKIYNKNGGHQCLEQRNYVFIKTMKCATQTLVQMFRRFGYRRRLNFVLPKTDHIYLGWPFLPSRRDYRHSSRTFNALVEHSVYNETIMKKLMPQDTLYVSIIREPWSHFKSAFSYFNVANISQVKNVPDRLSEYIRNIESYDKFYRTHEASARRFCIPDGFSTMKNLLCHCLGMPLGFPSNRDDISADLSKVQSYIESLDKNFALIMIMEYFHESLVLLKRLMCWSLEDILYHTSNVGNYSNKFNRPDPENLAKVKKWNRLDFMLYDHFNQSFWRKVRDQGDDFFPEVAVYNSLQDHVTQYCSSMENLKDPIIIQATEYHRKIVLNKDYCLILGLDLLNLLKTRAEFEEGPRDITTESPAQRRAC